MVEDRIASEVSAAGPSVAEAYLWGAAHDSTCSTLHRTTRFCQADPRWLSVLAQLLGMLRSRSWMYREGRTRSLWVLETSWRVVPRPFGCGLDAAAYARGYFDAEGGVPTSPNARFYIQLVQKSRTDLAHLRNTLIGLGIACGRLHNPSSRVDPDYWRFYVSKRSHPDFIDQVGSWHPRKRARLVMESEGILAAGGAPRRQGPG